MFTCDVYLLRACEVLIALSLYWGGKGGFPSTLGNSKSETERIPFFKRENTLPVLCMKVFLEECKLIMNNTCKQLHSIYYSIL